MSETDIGSNIFAYPAAVLRLATQEEMRGVAVERQIFDEERLKQYNPYFFRAEISNNRLDSYFTRMAPSTLKNYAADADAGVSFLYAHDPSEIIGRSMSGTFINAQGNGIARVLAEVYLLPNFQLGTVNTDQIIRGIDGMVLKDVSVGFYGGQWTCSICGRDMWRDWDCWHIPSVQYEIEGDGQVREEICIADIEDARLAEASAVYKGSTPDAVIGRANQEAERGRIKPEVRSFIEQRFRVHLPGKRIVVPGVSEENNMSQVNSNGNGKVETKPEDETRNAPADTATPPASTAPENPTAPENREVVEITSASVKEHSSFVRGLLKKAGVEGDNLFEGIRTLTDQAADGRAYRADLIEEALAEGVRANGAEWNRDGYSDVLKRASIDVIKLMRDDWKRSASSRFPGGRQTKDTAESGPPANQEPVDVPASIFRG